MNLELGWWLAMVFAISWAGCMVGLIAIFVMHVLTPKGMLHLYFREPHFSPAEIEFFTGFPFGYMRAVMFMRLAGFPKSGKKRGLTEAYLLSPRWYQIVSRIIIRMFTFTFVVMIIAGLVLFFVL